MNILITGGTGFIGKFLAKELALRNHNLIVLTRNKQRLDGKLSYPCRLIEWGELDTVFTELNVEAVIHLAGEPIAKKFWTNKLKKKIRDSRILTTQKLTHAITNSSVKVFVSCSAIGYYGDRGDEVLNEASGSGQNFLAKVCQDWEKEALQLKNVRTCIFRVGMVLGEGGALAQLAPIFRYGFGGALGDGKMWISWIHIEDLVNMFVWAVENPSANGTYNAVSPNPIRNVDFSTVLAKIFNKKLFFSVPKFILKRALGEMSQIILASQNVQPARALRENFEFCYFDLEEALRSIIKPRVL